MKTIENKWRRILVASILPIYLLITFTVGVVIPPIGIMMIMFLLLGILFALIYMWFNPN
jgi:hypothetical protein